jgi:uncharacterized protein (TIGR00304 family)
MILMIVGSILILIGFMVLIQEHKDEKTQVHDDSVGLSQRSKNKDSSCGAVVMVGPIPIVVGSDKKTAIIMMVIAMIIMLIWAIRVF